MTTETPLVDVGGRPAKSLADHLLDGTFRADRHGHLIGQGDGRLNFRPKPASKITASAASQSKWIRNASDERAVANGCRFNEALAQHVVDFFSAMLCHSKGSQWAGKPFELLPWQQAEIMFPLFGWVKPDGTRRFRRSYIEIPKKNGKSSIASGIGLYMLTADDEPGAEVYSLGADKDQARIVHSEAINMVDASLNLSACLKVNRSTGSITYPATRSFYRALSATPRGKHGLNIHSGIVDELHQWYGTELWETIKYGYRARTQPLQLVITNAGDDLESVCYHQREKAVAIINGTIQDDAFFALVCAVSREEAEGEIKAVAEGASVLPMARKCNPALGVVIQEEDLLADVKDAIQTPSELTNLLRLTYGVWATGGGEPWFQDPDWMACATEIDLESLAGRQCWAGLDLSSTTDLSALVLVFPDGDGAYDVLAFAWMPAERIKRREQRDRAGYSQWIREGKLTQTEGDVVDYDLIRADINKLRETYNIESIAIDRWNATQLAVQLAADGFDIAFFGQGYASMSAPSKVLEKLVVSGNLRHDGNPVLRWCAQNVRLERDSAGNIKPSKKTSTDRIDLIVALVMALGIAEKSDQGSTEYSTGGMFE